MAPDLNAMTSDGRWDYSTPGSGGYDVPNIVYNVSLLEKAGHQMTDYVQDPSSRKLKVLTIGAGLSSIQMAYMIQKHCQNVELVVYEKNAEIGGTWYENRYPGQSKIACWYMIRANITQVVLAIYRHMHTRSTLRSIQIGRDSSPMRPIS
jgi:hypothetical protein